MEPYRKARITRKIGTQQPVTYFCKFGTVYVHLYVKSELGYYLSWEKLEYGNIKNIEFLD